MAAFSEKNVIIGSLYIFIPIGNMFLLPADTAEYQNAG